MISWFWISVFPNLVASALWTWPVLGWHHRRVVRSVVRVVRDVEERKGDGE